MNIKDLLNKPVSAVMTTNLVKIGLDDTMETADKLLSLYKINHIPVVDEEGCIRGMLSKVDIQLLKDWGTNLGLNSSKFRNEQVLSTQLAGERMCKDVVTVTPADTLESCASIFAENLFHALPVVSGTKLVGLITTYDLLKAAYTDPVSLISSLSKAKTDA